MSTSVVLFWVFAVGALVTGFAVFRLNSMAQVTFALMASFLFGAAEVVLLGLAYLGVVIMLMMLIEMVIMAVFMIMYMMNPAGLMPMAMYHNKAGSMTISVGTFVLLGGGALLVPWPTGAGRPGGPPGPAPATGPGGGGTTRALGESLMGPQMLTMMTLGLVLFATIVACVVLATDRGRYDRFGPGRSARRPDDPVPGGVGRGVGR